MELLPFQAQASSQIAERLESYLRNPLMRTKTVPVPFYQNLSAITGAGKTLILANAVDQVRGRLPLRPVVLWLSKGKVVVWQTFTNLSSGKYATFLSDFDVKTLLDCSHDDISNPSKSLMLVATVAKFNQRDKERGDRKIFQVGLDAAEQSLWDMLKERWVQVDERRVKRPLVIVYDEGHNLSDQQTELLFELAPDAVIAASATTRVPEAMGNTIRRLKEDLGWKEEQLVTVVPSSEVVESGLVKKHIMLGGYVTPMEIAVDEMLEEMVQAEKTAADLGLPFKPAAIYVSKTNTVDDSPPGEDAMRAFEDRLARPILIWRYLTEKKGIDPSEIAVYCNLTFKKGYPPPEGFNLFSGGDSDYDDFIAGGYRHVIFNLSLQEGWDDPRVGFAYIDKDMGSPDQVTQVVGRVLRQPGTTHYPAPILNTAHFYIRTDDKGIFDAVLTDVQDKLAADIPTITMTVRKNRKSGSRPYKLALKTKHVHVTSVDTDKAFEPIEQVIKGIIDFRGDIASKEGGGERIQVLQAVGSGENAVQEWVDVAHSNPVRARWVFDRELKRLHKGAAQIADTVDGKFDALVEYHSDAAEHIREKAKEVVDAYITYTEIVQNSHEPPYVAPDIPVDEDKLVLFKHAVHEGYSDLNDLELRFAKAIDKTRRVWCRNPSQGGYSIPLVDEGDTKRFFPDFLVWVDKKVLAIDTKGKHLITDDSKRKLFYIKQAEPGQPELVIRLVTEGKWNVVGRAPNSVDKKDGYTVWTLRNGLLHPIHCKDVGEAVERSLNA